MKELYFCGGNACFAKEKKNSFRKFQNVFLEYFHAFYLVDLKG